MENCILQNNAINIYQQYFSDIEPSPLVEKNSARTVNVYQDQCAVTRPVTHISWSPDNSTKLAISHCNLKFQEIVPNQNTHSYIWQVGKSWTNKNLTLPATSNPVQLFQRIQTSHFSHWNPRLPAYVSNTTRKTPIRWWVVNLTGRSQCGTPERALNQSNWVSWNTATEIPLGVCSG